MSETLTSAEIESNLQQVQQAVAAEKLPQSAADHIRDWLTLPRYSKYVSQVQEHIAQQKWQELDDAFWTIIPFGTGGRRGKMYPIGSNAINDRTIGESAQGLADYVKETFADVKHLTCAIAYDTRHRSLEFAQLCAEVMVAAGYTVYFFDGVRSTPQLSFTVRQKKCDCGIMVTASHNPPSDNAVKVYWNTGGQILPPHDKKIVDRVMNVDKINQVSFQEAVQHGKVIYCQDEIDPAFIKAVANEAFEGPRDLNILYSPLHGVGSTAVVPALAADGFETVEVFSLHATPDGDFPNVPGHVSNPENPAVFDSIIEHGKASGAELIIASDPDCDRIGCAAPLTFDDRDNWATLTGNQIGVLLTYYLLEMRKQQDMLSPNNYIVKTLVTTEMIRRVADSYHVKTYGNLLVGFKWIGGLIDEMGLDDFVFGAEESHGYLTGTYARDKDGAVAAMLLAELAARLKQQGQTIHQKLDQLFSELGIHTEKTISITMPGSEGMKDMKKLMACFRSEPPESLAGMKVVEMKDYLNQQVVKAGGQPKSLDAPCGDMVILSLEQEGNYIAVRPSGTEPKVKFYMFTYLPPQNIEALPQAKEKLQQRVVQLENDLSAYAKS